MSKRLQVLLDEDELRDLQEVAAAHGTTLSQWVRNVLRSARAGEPRVGIDRKLDAVRAATEHQLPTGHIDGMPAEIERGYGYGSGRPS